MLVIEEKRFSNNIMYNYVILLYNLCIIIINILFIVYIFFTTATTPTPNIFSATLYIYTRIHIFLLFFLLFFYNYA